jgi:hypothetical protein
MTRRKKCDHHPDLVRILCADLITILLTFSHYIKIKKPRSLFALFNKAGPPMKTKLWKKKALRASSRDNHGGIKTTSGTQFVRLFKN